MVDVVVGGLGRVGADPERHPVQALGPDLYAAVDEHVGVVGEPERVVGVPFGRHRMAGGLVDDRLGCRGRVAGLGVAGPDAVGEQVAHCQPRSRGR